MTKVVVIGLLVAFAIYLAWTAYDIALGLRPRERAAVLAVFVAVAAVSWATGWRPF